MSDFVPAMAPSVAQPPQGRGGMVTSDLFRCSLSAAVAPLLTFGNNCSSTFQFVRNGMAEQGTVRNGGDLLSDLKQLLRTSEGEEHIRKALFGASEISLDAFRSALANPEVGLPHPANDAITKELFDMLDITGSGSLMSDELFQALKPEPGPVSTDPPANSAAPPGEQATSGGAAVKPAVPLEAPVSQAESANKIAPAVKAAATPPTSEPQAVSATSTAAAPPPTAPSDPLPAAVQAGLDQLPATLPSAPEAPAPIPVVPVDSVSVSQAHPAAALAQAQASDSTAHKVAAVSSDGENVGSVGGVVPPSVPQAQEQKKEQDQKEQEQALAQVQQQRSMAMLQDALRSKSDRCVGRCTRFQSAPLGLATHP